ncbi:hypothetical protein IQ235_02610 [Oscillatoriales cyanobacterium LEGE 11467]|uniref:Orc1-like AAA ATPase domain-containing protein n=1 Tax=Zarconia navalis LEGE 11467 TaxID=1828826 RepID=A0A928VSY2_9CYAN|nr:ATP-binding protein [Zarconia navalis]MBE9039687.1 hypothetical protein [Zarconia navalis LEGE 11467]
MEQRAIASIKEINAAIESGNPFEGRSTVREPEIWGRNCPDLETFNHRAIDRVWKEIDRVEQSGQRIRSMTALGESGMGKSHFIGRLRHRLRARGKGLFLYVNVQHFTNPNTIRSSLLYEIVNSLRYTGSSGVMQWQELAAFWVNRALFFTQSDSANLTPQKLVRKLTHRSLAQNQLWVNQVTEILFKAQPDIEHPDAIRATIWTLCNDLAPFARNWLARRKLAGWKLDELGLPDWSWENRESAAWEMTLQILQAIGDYSIAAICFDGFDADEPQETVRKKEQAIATCIDRLRESLRQKERRYGVVLLGAMTPTTWYDKLEPFWGKRRSLGASEPIELDTPDSETIGAIIARWLQDFYSERHLIPPTPVYPFDAIQLQALIRENLTLSEIIEWCEANFQPVEIDPLERVEQVFDRAVADDWSDVLEDDRAMAAALCFRFQCAIGQTIAGVEIEAVSDDITPKTFNCNYINFKILGREGNRSVSIGVAVMGSDRPQTVGATLKRLVQCDRLGLTRTCLIRSHGKPIPGHWKASRDLKAWLDRSQGKWIDADPKALAPLLALHSVYLHRDTHQLEGAQISDFVRQRREIAQNPLIAKILQAPAAAMSGVLSPDTTHSSKENTSGATQTAIGQNPFGTSFSPHPSSSQLHQ